MSGGDKVLAHGVLPSNNTYDVDVSVVAWKTHSGKGTEPEIKDSQLVCGGAF